MERIVKYISKIVGNNSDVDVKENYDEVIEQIHREFNSAGEELLKQANEILEEASNQDFDKADKLAKFGFKSVPELKEKREIKKRAEISKKQAELIRYYKREYPLNNFITEEQVKEICDKYNLVHGDVSRFKGFVPKKNLDEIEKFKVKEEDVDFLKAIECDYRGNPTGREFQLERAYIDYGCSIEREIIEQIGWERVKFIDSLHSLNRFKHIYKKGVQGKSAFQVDGGDNIFYSTDRYNLFGLKGEEIDRLKIESNKDTFSICAPVKDMDMTGMEITEGYKMRKKIEIPDPVVLKEVIGGYLIVTAWGDEASDPIVVNTINN